MSDKVKIYCPFCDQEYIVDRLQPGQKVECGSCEKTFFVNEDEMFDIEENDDSKTEQPQKQECKQQNVTQKSKKFDLKIFIISILVIIVLILSLVTLFKSSSVPHSLKNKDIANVVIKSMQSGVDEWIRLAKRGDVKRFIVVRLPYEITSNRESLATAKLMIQYAANLAENEPFSNIIKDFVITSEDGAYVLGSVSIN